MTDKKFYFDEENCVGIHYDNHLLAIAYSSIDAEKIVHELNLLLEENKQLKQLIKKVLETTPMEHELAVKLKNKVREFYE